MGLKRCLKLLRKILDGGYLKDNKELSEDVKRELEFNEPRYFGGGLWLL